MSVKSFSARKTEELCLCMRGSKLEQGRKKSESEIPKPEVTEVV